MTFLERWNVGAFGAAVVLLPLSINAFGMSASFGSGQFDFTMIGWVMALLTPIVSGIAIIYGRMRHVRGRSPSYTGQAAAACWSIIGGLMLVVGTLSSSA